MCTSVSLEKNKQCFLKTELQNSPHLPLGDPLNKIPASKKKFCRGVESDKDVSDQNIFATPPSGIITPKTFSFISST